MFDPYSTPDPITPTGSLLLAELGMDIAAVRDALADEFDTRAPRTARHAKLSSA